MQSPTTEDPKLSAAAERFLVLVGRVLEQVVVEHAAANIAGSSVERIEEPDLQKAFQKLAELGFPGLTDRVAVSGERWRLWREMKATG